MEKKIDYLRNRRAFDLYLKDKNLSERFYASFNHPIGIEYRKTRHAPVGEEAYFKKVRPALWMASAFDWEHFREGNEIVWWDDYSFTWEDMIYLRKYSKTDYPDGIPDHLISISKLAKKYFMPEINKLTKVV